MAGNLRGRLWGGDSSSSNSSSSESEDEAPAAQAADQGKKARVVWAEESSSDEEVVTKRKVVSHADKRFDQLKDAIKLMKNHMKVNDFALITTDYEGICKALDKMKLAIEAAGGPPGFFVKAITNAEAYCERMHAEHIENKANKGQKLPENKQKAFNTLRAKVRKGNKVFEDLVKQCKENPEQFEEAQQEEGGSDDGSSGSSMKSSGSDSGSSGSSDSSDSDSSDSDSDSSDSDSDSEESDSYKSGTDSDSDDEGDEEAAREKKMLRWLITPEQAAKNAVKTKDKAEKTEGNAKKNTNKAAKTPKQSNKAPKEDDKDAKSKEKEEYTPEQLMQKVTEIAQMRGRRQYVRKDYMEKLQLLEEHAVKQGPRAQLYILVTMVSADFDNTGSAFESMKLAMWIEAYEKVCKMLPLLMDSYAESVEQKGEDAVDEEDPRSHARLQELFVAFVEKLDDELYKALQLTMDVYGTEYQDILANSSKYLILNKRVLKFFTDTNQTQQIGLISLRLMEQLYYKPDELNKAVYDSIRGSVPEDQKDDWHWPENSKEFMTKLCGNVFAKGKFMRARIAAAEPVDPNAVPDAQTNSQTRLHRRASLCQAYHLALHDNFQTARDLLHLGNLQEQAMDADVNTQILYNRVLAMMGLCAFRLGKIADAHTFLMDVCMHNKARELLAQGLSFAKNMDRTPEQERAEKMRQLPYHMHINLEVLESAHRICAMLLEVPNLAMQSIDPNNKRIISRVLRRALEDYDKKVFTGPPEDAKEAVVYAAKALQRGDWQCALESLEDLKIWDHIDPGNVEAGAKVKTMITERIQTEALRTYLFAYSSIYDAFHLDQLVAMFGLPPKLVHSIVSKMMIREEITAFWDESSKYVLVEHSEPTPLQRLALTLADRGAQAVENNERLVDQKSGGYGFNRGAQAQGQQGRFDQGGGGKGDRGRFGKGGFDSKGKGKGGRGKGTGAARPQMRGWENARAGAIRGNAQRGWATGTTQAAPSSRFG